MSSSKHSPNHNDDRREDFKIKVWFLEITWRRLTKLGLIALAIILFFVWAIVRL